MLVLYRKIYIQKVLNSLKNTYYKSQTHNSIQIRPENNNQLIKIKMTFCLYSFANTRNMNRSAATDHRNVDSLRLDAPRLQFKKKYLITRRIVHFDWKSVGTVSKRSNTN